MSDPTGYTLKGVKATRFSEKAMLVRLKDGSERWVPNSVVHDDSEVYNAANAEGKLVVHMWWAQKEGLVE
jgi:hypothetical protein